MRRIFLDDDDDYDYESWRRVRVSQGVKMPRCEDDAMCDGRTRRRDAHGAAVREEGGWSSRARDGDTARARIARDGRRARARVCVRVLVD